MSSDTVYRFEETSGCPPLEELLSFSLTALRESSLKRISHLEMCDFCSSEAHFFSRLTIPFPSPLPEMPLHLRVLPESLLRKDF